MAAEQQGSSSRKLPIALILIVLLLSFVLALLLGPLKEMIFPAKRVPTLALVVVESAEEAEGAGLFRIVVEAIVEGNPKPQVSFNRNDGIGQLSENTTLILLNNEEEFLLKAVATNSEGTAQAELMLYSGINPGSATRHADLLATESEGPEDSTAAVVDGGSVNQAPRIIDIIIAGESIIANLSEAYPLPYEENTYSVILIIEDTDDEDVDLQVQASHGDVGETGDLLGEGMHPENLIRKFAVWRSPSNPAGNLEPLPVTLNLTVVDPVGARDQLTVSLALIPARADPVLPPEEPEVRYTGSFMMRCNASLSGYVASNGGVMTGVILLGDSSDNRQYKGYLSFPMIWIGPAESNLRIEAVDLVFENINISGDPAGLADLVEFKVCEYGAALDAGDFTVGGRPLFNVNTGHFNTTGGIPAVYGSAAGSAVLKDEVRNAFSSRQDFLQIGVGLNNSTNGNGISDIFQAHASSIHLIVHFSYTRD